MTFSMRCLLPIFVRMDKPEKTKPEEEAGKAANGEKASDPVASPGPALTPDEDAEDPFDFGGLPNRNLKKNLGCG